MSKTVVFSIFPLMKKGVVYCLVLFLASCGEDDVAPIQAECWLTSAPWELEYITETVYLEGSVEREDTIKLSSPTQRDILTFYPNHEVAFIYPYSDTTLQGNWQLSETDLYLSTTLTLNADQLFYPYSKVAELTEEKLVLQTDTVYWYYTYEEDGNVQSVPYSTIRANHFAH